MNEDDTPIENSIAESSANDPEDRYTFEWPDEKGSTDNLTDKLVLAGNDSRGEHLGNWALFWVLTWLGTALAGGLFGGALGMFGIFSGDPTAPLFVFLWGAMWAGGVGLFVFAHLGAICWTFFWLGRPMVTAMIAGLLTGMFCGLVLFSLVTGPLGMLGAYLAGNWFLKTESGKQFQATIKSNQAKSAGRLRFTTTDLLLRMTVISVMIAAWTAWFKSL